MAIDPTTNVYTQSNPTFSKGVEPAISSPEFLKELQVPQEVIQEVIRDRRVIAQFFSTQSARLNHLQFKEGDSLKAESGALPEFEMVADEMEQYVPSVEDQEILEETFQSVRQSLQLQSEEPDQVDRVIRQAEEIVGQNPSPGGSGSRGSSSDDPIDVLDQIFLQQTNERRREDDEMFRKLFLAAKDPESCVLLIAQKTTYEWSLKQRKLLEGMRDNISNGDVVRAELSGGSTVDIAKANAGLAKNTQITSLISFQFQQCTAHISRIENMAKGVLDSIHQQELTLARNTVAGR